MYTLVTGAPGAGKTAMLVDLLMGIDPSRPIFNDGLEGLSLPGRQIHPLDATKWPDEVPDGAIVVVDEAQRVWRPRGPASAAPRHVTEMETHRHRGLDFFCTTQAPRLIDANIRSLVGRHVHIRDTGILGRQMYEWPECNENMAWKTCVNKRKYKLPKRAFANYVSASLHTKPIRKVPPALLWALFVGLGAVVLMFMVYRIIVRGSPVAPAKDAPAVTAPAAQSASAPGARVVDDRVDWMPRVSSRPESAPAFDHLRQVVAMPVVVGCVAAAGRARCFTQQGTDAGLSEREAREWLAQPRFDPYAAPKQAMEGRGADKASEGAEARSEARPGLIIMDSPAPSPAAAARKQG